MKRAFLFLAFCLCLQFFVFAQEEEESFEVEIEGKHSVSLVLTHSWIPQGRNFEGNKEYLVVPGFAFDYNYWFSKKWAVGLHTDFLNENFFVETNEGELLERDRPIAPALMAVFKPGNRWLFAVGMGREFADEESFTLTRLSIEYGVELPKRWEVFGVLTQDFRWNAYDATNIGIGLAKRL